MSRLHRVGITGLAVLLLAGIWLFVSPFMFDYQPQGSHWVDATRNDLWTGGLLALAALAGIVGIAVATVRDLIHAASRNADTADAAERRGAFGNTQ